jgi:cytoskeletal protein CcmA (bactofilin family)
MTISGTSEINGSITAENMTVSATSKVRGDSTLKKIKVSGTTCIDGNLKSEEVSISGSIDIGKDCEAENFTARGGFNIGGLLNAGNIEIYIGGSCRAKEIGGEKIDARQLGGGAFIWNSIMNFFSSHGGRLTAEVIEGDNIYLEYTIAKVVRGNNIQIGPECVIDLVEYRNELNVNSGSTVREQKKI